MELNIQNKKRILYWGDSPTVKTGFGIVTKALLSSLYKTGLYDIEVVGINYHGLFYDQNELPYQIVPAKSLNPSNPHGHELFLNTIRTRKYDCVIIQNDIYVLAKIEKEIIEFKQKFPNVKFFYYFPVDCRIDQRASGILKVMDTIVTYTDFGVKEVIKVYPELKDKIKRIYLGVDEKKYKRIDPAKRKYLRKQIFNIEDDTFLIVNVNRNSARKMLAHNLSAFYEFKKKVPNSILYLHTTPIDTAGTQFSASIDLFSAATNLGLKLGKDVLFPPPGYSPQQAVSDEILNDIINCGDMAMSTALGEGFGCTIPIYMLNKIPTLVPNDTNMKEFKGLYYYDCKERVMIDTQGYRPMGRLEDVTNMMNVVYGQVKTKSVQLEKNLNKAYEWAINHTWDHMGEEWVKLLNEEADKPCLKIEDMINTNLVTDVL